MAWMERLCRRASDGGLVSGGVGVDLGFELNVVCDSVSYQQRGGLPADLALCCHVGMLSSGRVSVDLISRLEFQLI